MNWIAPKEAMPPLIDDEPQEVELFTGLDDETTIKLTGFFENNTWWIKLSHPMVGHQDIRTFSFDLQVIYWRYLTPTTQTKH